MNNTFFQYYWNFKKKFFQRHTGNPAILENYADKMISQLETASSFGKINLVLIGDSNMENVSQLDKMLKFKPVGITCNIAIGGTTAKSWYDLFQTPKGKKIISIIQSHNAKVIFNIGGNHVLQNTEYQAEEYLLSLKNTFPYSYNCTIPPIRYDLVSLATNRSDSDIIKDIFDINNLIVNIWGIKAIDMHTPFTNYSDNGFPYLLVQSDGVHFTDQVTINYRIPVFMWYLTTLG